MPDRAAKVFPIILVTNLLVMFMCGVALASRFVGLKGHESLLEIFIYKGFADQAFSGKIPYQDFLVEYPLLSLPLFLLPRMFASTPGGYVVAFVSQILCINSVLMWALAGSVQDDQVSKRLWWYGAAVVCLSPLAVARFDLAPALLTLVGVRFANRSKYGISGAAIGLGILTKLSPALALVAVWLRAGSHSARIRLLLSALLTTFGGLAVWWMVGKSNMVGAITYHADRGLQIESIYATGLATLSPLFGIPAKLTFRYGCDELVGPAAAILAKVAFPLQIVVLTMVTGQIWRRRIDVWAATGCLFLTFTLFGKVLSPQYLFWILPFVALADTERYPRARGTMLGACLVSTLLFPWLYSDVRSLTPLAIALLNTRLGLLLYLLWHLLHPAPFKTNPILPSSKGTACDVVSACTP